MLTLIGLQRYIVTTNQCNTDMEKFFFGLFMALGAMFFALAGAGLGNMDMLAFSVYGFFGVMFVKAAVKIKNNDPSKRT